MRPEVDAPFFFETVRRLETQAAAECHPHYGRVRAWRLVLEQRLTLG